MEYRIGTRMRVIVFLCAVLFGGLGLFMMAGVFTGQKPLGLFLVMGVFFLAFTLWMVLTVLKTRLKIDDQSITMQTAFTRRTLLLKDIAGYRLAGYNYMYLVPKARSRPIKISANFQGQKEIYDWVKMRYDDVDALQQQRDREDILTNEKFGETEDDRWFNLKRANNMVAAASANAIALLLWEIFYPQPYAILMILLLIAPWVAVYGTWYSRGLIRLTKKKGSGYPTLAMLMILPIVGIIVAILRDYKLYEFSSGNWVVLGVVSVAVTVLFVIFCMKALAAERRKWLVVLFILFFSALYSFGLLVFYNCYYDRTEPQGWRVPVVGKRISTGRYSDTYYLQLGAWGRWEEGHDVDVPKKMYNAVDRGDTLNVFLRQGKLGIKWYWVMP